MLDFRRSVTFPFRDDNWSKQMLIGAGVYLVPILNFALSGYGLDVQRRVARGEDVPLPTWNDLSAHLMDGLKLLAVQAIYSIPAFLIMALMVAMSVVFSVSTQDVEESLRDSTAATFGALMVILFALLLLYVLIYAFMTPAVQIQVARSEQIASVFRFNEMFTLINRRTGDYLLVFFLPLLPGIAVGILIFALVALPALLVCLYLPIMFVSALLAPYLTMVTRHWYGQLMRE